MTRDQGRPGRHHAGPWLGGLGAWLLFILLLAPTPAGARQPTTYAQCLRTYSARTDAAAYCRRLFPATAPPSRTSVAAARPVSTVGGATTTVPPPSTAAPSTPTPYERCVAATGRTAEAQKLCAQRNPGSAPAQTPPTQAPPTQAPPREPVDVTKPVNTFLEGLFTRPKTPTTPTPPRTPADPLAVIPEIQAACAPYAGNADRWRRCTVDGWRKAGLRGQPPVVLQVPPAPPPVVQPPEPPPRPPPASAEKPTQRDPVRPPPPPAPPKVAPPPVEPPPATTVAPPPEGVAPPVVTRPPEPLLPPAPPPATVPIWAWIVALVVAVVVAAGGGFGLAKLLERAKLRSASAPTPAAPPLGKPDIALVADPGLVVIETDGPPRRSAGQGLAVSVRCTRAPDSGEVRLDYPSLESAP